MIDNAQLMPYSAVQSVLPDGERQNPQTSRVFLLEGSMMGARPTLHLRKRGRAGMEQRDRIMRRDHGLCRVCRSSARLVRATAVDHIIALINGGTNDDENMQALCAACHVIKTAQDKGHTVRPGCDANGEPLTPVEGWNDEGGGGAKLSEEEVPDTVAEGSK